MDAEVPVAVVDMIAMGSISPYTVVLPPYPSTTLRLPTVYVVGIATKFSVVLMSTDR
jgi:hypothetical protein